MGLPRKGQQEKAGADEGTLNKHSCKENPQTKPKLRKHGIPHMAERGDAQEVEKVKGRKALPDQDVRVLYGPRAPQSQYSEGDYKKPEQNLRGGVKGIAFYAINVDEGQNQEDQQGPEKPQHATQLVRDGT